MSDPGSSPAPERGPQLAARPAVTFRSDKGSDRNNTFLKLSGRIQAQGLRELEMQLEEARPDIVLDLEQVTLVDVAVVRFLVRLEQGGVELRHCPRFVDAWMALETKQVRRRHLPRMNDAQGKSTLHSSRTWWMSEWQMPQ